MNHDHEEYAVRCPHCGSFLVTTSKTSHFLGIQIRIHCQQCGRQASHVST